MPYHTKASYAPVPLHLSPLGPECCVLLSLLASCKDVPCLFLSCFGESRARPSEKHPDTLGEGTSVSTGEDQREHQQFGASLWLNSADLTGGSWLKSTLTFQLLALDFRGVRQGNWR